MDTYHLVKHDNHWQLLREGDDKASLTATTKIGALDKAHAFLINRKSVLKVHGHSGEVQEEWTYPRSEEAVKILR